MTARIALKISQQTQQLGIPDYTVVTSDGIDHVYKVVGDQAVLTDIVIADKIGSTILLESGLAEGDTIVSVGMKNLGVRTRVWIEELN
jgi:hypothetical protein